METTGLERSVLCYISDNWKEHDHRIRDIKAENNSSFRQGAGKKLKLCGKKLRLCGKLCRIAQCCDQKKSLLSQENDNFASISDKIKNASYRSSNQKFSQSLEWKFRSIVSSQSCLRYGLCQELVDSLVISPATWIFSAATRIDLSTIFWSQSFVVQCGAIYQQFWFVICQTIVAIREWKIGLVVETSAQASAELTPYWFFIRSIFISMERVRFLRLFWNVKLLKPCLKVTRSRGDQ